MCNLEGNDELIEFLTKGDVSHHYEFNKILIRNRNNTPLSISLFRDWLRLNTNRGIVCKDSLELVSNFSNMDELNKLLNEMFLDTISEEKCSHAMSVLSKKNVTLLEFYTCHTKNVDKPLLRLLSSLRSV